MALPLSHSSDKGSKTPFDGKDAFPVDRLRKLGGDIKFTFLY